MKTVKKADGFENEEMFFISDSLIEKFGETPIGKILTVIGFGHFPHAAGHLIQRPNGCRTGLMMYCTSGTGYYSINGGPALTLSAKQLIILPPGVPHEYGASNDNPWSIYWAHIKGSFFDSIYNMVSRDMPITIPDVFGERLRELFRQCLCIVKIPYQEEEFIYLCQLISTVLSLIPCAIKQSIVQTSIIGAPEIDRTISFMQRHLHESITLPQLSAEVRYSQSHLNYLFKKSMGYAPMQFFLRIKVQAAARELYYTNTSIKDIAASYGIEDPYYFSRLFKSIMGISPKKFRNKKIEEE
jgi:AraC-like DNA-binding protein